MKTKLLASIFGLALLVLPIGCSGRDQKIVSAYFDGVLRNDVALYRLGGITGKVVRNYEIVSTHDGLAVVRITYAAVAGNDLVCTKRYRISDTGKLHPIETEDIDAEVQHNLALLLLQANQEHGFGANLRDCRIIYSQLSPAALTLLPMLDSQAGENYGDVMLETGRHAFDRASITLPDGRTLTVEYDDAASLMM